MEDSTEGRNIIKASLVKRFINYLVDYVVNIIAISIILSFYAGMGYNILNDLESLRGRIIAMLLYALVYVLIEGGLKGKTLGKFLTKTRVVEYDGTTPQFETFVIRSFCRIIPFEPLSFLFFREGWHDRLSRSMVMDEQLSDLKD